VKIAEGMGRLYYTFPSNLSKISILGVLHPCRCTDGVIFGVEEGTSVPSSKVPSSTPNFTPIGAKCRPCGAKNLKIGLWVN